MVAGFAEQPQAALTPDAGSVASEPPAAPLSATLRLGPGGRVVIPAEMRDAMGLKQGDGLLATLADGELRMVTLAATVRELQALTRLYVPDGVSLVDELIAERRAEAAAED